VHATLGVGVDVLDLVLDDGRGVLALLGELDGAGDTGVSADDSNCGAPRSFTACAARERSVRRKGCRKQAGRCEC